MKNDNFVYFMRVTGMADSPVKIGYSWNPEERAKHYTLTSPYPLEIVYEMPGSATLEGRFHCYFTHLHSHHEWFRAAPELLEAIEELKAGTFDFDKLPTGKNHFRQVSARKTWANRQRAAA